MAVAFTEQSQIGATTWYYTWTSGTAPNGPFYVYLDGQYVATVYQPFYQLEVAAGEQVQIEVLDDTSAPGDAYPGRMVLSWDAPVEATASYRVDEYVGGVWTQVSLMQPGPGQTHFEYQTGPLADLSAHQYRVVAVDAAGNDGVAKNFAVTMVRRPDPPVATRTWNQITGMMTVAVG